MVSQLYTFKYKFEGIDLIYCNCVCLDCFPFSCVSYNIIVAAGENSCARDGNCFYRAVALWRDETRDRKHEEIRRLSSSFIEHPQVFQPLLFSSSSVEEHVKKRQNYSEPEQKLWTFLVVQHLNLTYLTSTLNFWQFIAVAHDRTSCLFFGE